MIWIMPLVVETALLKRSLKMMRVILAMTQRTRVMTSGWRKSIEILIVWLTTRTGMGKRMGMRTRITLRKSQMIRRKPMIAGVEIML